MGLGALLGPSNTNKGSVNKIDISKISPNKQQPRKNFDEKEVQELSSSIKNQGLIQPIIVRDTGNNDYEIIAGERRWRACQLAGLHSVDCVVLEASEDKVFELALIENVQREDLNVVEEAKAYKKLIEANNIKTEELSKKLGKSTSHISNLIRILELDEEIHNMIISKFFRGCCLFGKIFEISILLMLPLLVFGEPSNAPRPIPSLLFSLLIY